MRNDQPSALQQVVNNFQKGASNIGTAVSNVVNSAAQSWRQAKPVGGLAGQAIQSFTRPSQSNFANFTPTYQQATQVAQQPYTAPPITIKPIQLAQNIANTWRPMIDYSYGQHGKVAGGIVGSAIQNLLGGGSPEQRAFIQQAQQTFRQKTGQNLATPALGTGGFQVGIMKRTPQWNTFTPQERQLLEQYQKFSEESAMATAIGAIAEGVGPKISPLKREAAGAKEAQIIEPAQVSAPVQPPAQIPQAPQPFKHLSVTPNLTTLDPAFAGTGAAGTETAYKAYPQLNTKGVFLYHPNIEPEGVVEKKAMNVYTGTTGGKFLEPNTSDEARLIDKATKFIESQPELYAPYDTNAINAAIQHLAQEEGFIGMKTDQGFKIWDKVPVEIDIAQTALRKTMGTGGATINLKGYQPTEGYSYSPYKGLEVAVDKKQFEATPLDHYNNYVDKNLAVLQQSGNFIGMWEDKGTIYMDVSRVGAPDFQTMKEAFDNQQLAVYDLKTGETIYTPHSPEYGKKTSIYDTNWREILGGDKVGRGASVTGENATSVQGQAPIIPAGGGKGDYGTGTTGISSSTSGLTPPTSGPGIQTAQDAQLALDALNRARGYTPPEPTPPTPKTPYGVKTRINQLQTTQQEIQQHINDVDNYLQNYDFFQKQTAPTPVIDHERFIELSNMKAEFQSNVDRLETLVKYRDLYVQVVPNLPTAKELTATRQELIKNIGAIEKEIQSIQNPPETPTATGLMSQKELTQLKSDLSKNLTTVNKELVDLQKQVVLPTPTVKPATEQELAMEALNKTRGYTPEEMAQTAPINLQSTPLGVEAGQIPTNEELAMKQVQQRTAPETVEPTIETVAPETLTTDEADQLFGTNPLPPHSQGRAPFSGYTGPVRTVGRLEKIWNRTRNIISEQGETGQVLAQALQDARTMSETLAGKWSSQMRTIKSLSNGEFDNFIDVAQGLAVPKNQKVTQAVAEWNEVRNQIADLADTEGVLIGHRENYYPHSGLEKNLKGNNFERAIEHLLKTNQAGNRIEAAQKLRRVQDTIRNRRQGNLEIEREIDLPEYDRTKSGLWNYLATAAERISQVHYFGKNDAKAMESIAKISQDGFDASTAKEAFDVAVGAKKYNETSIKISGFLRSLQTAINLSLSALTNAQQSVNTASVTGVLRTFFNIPKALLSQEAQNYVETTGVTLDTTMQQLRQGAGLEGMAGKVGAPFFNTVERFNRTLAAVAGRDFAVDLAKKSSQGDKGAIAELNKMGLDGEDIATRGILTDEEQILASRNIVERTQFKVDPQDLPMWASSPWGKLVAQFRQFSYNQTAFMWNEVLKPAAKFNFAPLAIFILLGIPIGYGVGELRNKLRLKSTDDKSRTEKLISAFNQVGGGGIIGNTAMSAIPYSPTETKLEYMAQQAGNLGGPTAGLVTDIATKYAEDNTKGLKKLAISKIPLVGPTLKNYIFAYNPPADTKKYLEARTEAAKGASTRVKQQLDYYNTAQSKGGPDAIQSNDMLIRAIMSKDTEDQELFERIYQQEHVGNPDNPLWSQSKEFVKDYTAWRFAVELGKTQEAAQLALKYANTATPLPVIQRQYQEYVVPKQQASYQQAQQTINQPGFLGLPNPYQIQQVLGVAPQLNTTPPPALSNITPIQRLSRDNPRLAAAAQAYTALPGTASTNPAKRALLNQYPELKTYWDEREMFYNNPANVPPSSPLDQYLASIGITVPTGEGMGRSAYTRQPRRTATSAGAKGSIKIKLGKSSKGKSGLSFQKGRASYRPLQAILKGLKYKASRRSPMKISFKGPVKFTTLPYNTPRRIA